MQSLFKHTSKYLAVFLCLVLLCSITIFKPVEAHAEPLTIAIVAGGLAVALIGAGITYAVTGTSDTFQNYIQNWISTKNIASATLTTIVAGISTVVDTSGVGHLVFDSASRLALNSLASDYISDNNLSVGDSSVILQSNVLNVEPYVYIDLAGNTIDNRVGNTYVYCSINGVTRELVSSGGYVYYVSYSTELSSTSSSRFNFNVIAYYYLPNKSGGFDTSLSILHNVTQSYTFATFHLSESDFSGSVSASYPSALAGWNNYNDVASDVIVSSPLISGTQSVTDAIGSLLSGVSENEDTNLTFSDSLTAPDTNVTEQEFWNTGVDFWDSTTAWLQSTWENAISDISDIITDIKEGIQDLAGNIADALEAAFAGVLEAIQSLVADIKAEFELHNPFVPSTPTFAPFQSLKNSFLGIWHYVREWLGTLSNYLSFFTTTLSILPYAMIVPVYAMIVIVIVSFILKRFFS